jgi:hypothetical protein
MTMAFKRAGLRKPSGRSRITNGNVLIPGIDQRSPWVRRARDLIDLHLSDLGGADNVSEAERSIVRRAAVLTTELELMERTFALSEGAKLEELQVYQTCANTLSRLLKSVGLQRRSRDVTPDLHDYINSRSGDDDE